MIIEGLCVFGIPVISNTNTGKVSPNVFDAGAISEVASMLFGNRGSDLAIVGHTVVTADDNPTLTVELRGADNAALTTNLTVIGTTGEIVYGADGSTAIVSGADVAFKFKVNQQRVAKRFYGLWVTLGGTNPDTPDPATGTAALVIDDQSNDYRAAAATP